MAGCAGQATCAPASRHSAAEPVQSMAAVGWTTHPEAKPISASRSLARSARTTGSCLISRMLFSAAISRSAQAASASPPANGSSQTRPRRTASCSGSPPASRRQNSSVAGPCNGAPGCAPPDRNSPHTNRCRPWIARPPTRSPASTSTTRAPPRAAASAATMPAVPAPTTATSHRSARGFIAVAALRSATVAGIHPARSRLRLRAGRLRDRTGPRGSRRRCGSGSTPVRAARA